MLAESHEQRHKRAYGRMMARIDWARRDPNAYIEYTTIVPPQNVDEGGGVRWARQDPIHREWQQMWTDHRRAVLLAPVGTAKSTQLRKRLEWEIGRNPDLMISYISGSELLPKKQLATMQEEIERNPRVRHVFPHLMASRGKDERGNPLRESWSAKSLLVRRKLLAPDPTMQVFGLLGKILGSRSDIVVLDDVINFENSFTEEGCNKVFSWLGEVISRLKPGARVWAIGHIWKENDALQRLARKKQWFYRRDEILLINEEKVRENLGPEALGTEIKLDAAAMEPDEIRERAGRGELESLSPGIFNIEDIIEKMEDLTQAFVLLMLFNRLLHDLASRFKDAWFKRCLKLGAGLATADNPEGFLDTWSGGDGLTYTGVDLGTRKEVGSDLTVLWTMAVLPDGTRQVIDVRSGRWEGPEILSQIEDVVARFGSIVSVENNVAQIFLLQFAEDLTCMPVRHHNTTGVNKHDMAHGVEALGIELAQGKYMLPCTDDLIPGKEIGAAIKGCKSYDPKRHASDHLMAWWICKEGIRLSPAAQTVELPDLDLFSRL